MSPMKKATASRQNILYDGTLKVSRLVCASCMVPFKQEAKVPTGFDDAGCPIYVCRDCQRLIPWEEEDTGVDFW